MVTATDPRRNHGRPAPQPPALRTVPPPPPADASPGAARPAAPDPSAARHGDRHRAGRRTSAAWARGTPLGHGFSGGRTQTASGTAGQSNVSTDGPGGITTIPGNGGWTWSGGSGGITVPADPYADPDGGSSGDRSQSTPSQGSSTDTTSQASGSQLTGLVRIVSTR